MAIPRVIIPMVMAGMLLTAGGCMVGKGRYELQAARSASLDEQNSVLRAQLGALQQQNTDLASINIGLTQQVEILKRHSVGLQSEKKRLAAERQRLQQELEAERQTYDNLLEQMKDEIEQGQITISQLEGRLTVNLVEEILFDSGQAAIKTAGRDVLKRVAGILKDVSDHDIQVEGHTDNVPIGAGLARLYPTNWELSAARAITVTRFLELQGVPAGRLGAAAYGQHRPVAGNDTPAGRSRNRRIAIILSPRG